MNNLDIFTCIQIFWTPYIIQGLHAPWKSLKIAVSAGKSLNFGATFIQTRFSGS